MHRDESIRQLKEQVFDILVIGGGATGTGIVLDAATRGLKVALVERDDFASETSSKSTKLIHGGVRYLEQAVKGFDRDQLYLVRDALQERATLLKIAPHLTRPLALLTPIYRWFEVPYFRIGLKIYDFLAGRSNLFPSRFVGRRQALREFPMLKEQGLRGGVIYSDGQFDDARMNVSIGLTAVEQGAIVLNHAEVLNLIHEDQRVCGAYLKDRIGGEEWSVRAKVMVNATGPFVDQIRKLDDPQTAPLLKASSGVHVILDQKFSPPDTGLLIPKTEDGRVLFLLPWLNHTLVGTTDNPAPIEYHPKPREKDIEYILRHLNRYFNLPVTRKDVLASWSGLRPLVADPKKADTAKLSRDHVIHISPSGLLTITGGKWTTYRKMALDAVDQAVKLGPLHPKNASRTANTQLVGGRRYRSTLRKELQERYGLSDLIASHLSLSYGGRAEQVLELAQGQYRNPLVDDFPYLWGEVIYAVRHEMAQTAVDVLARRTRLAFLNREAALAALSPVIELMAKELHWDASRIKREEQEALEYLKY